MARHRENIPANDFIDNQCHEAGYSNLTEWAKAIKVAPKTLYNLASRNSNVATLELHIKLAKSRKLSLAVWAKRYIEAVHQSEAA